MHRIALDAGTSQATGHRDLHEAIGVQADPDGVLLWISAAEPGSRRDLARLPIHALPALYPAAAPRLRALADVGYHGAGIGIHTPLRLTPTFPAC